MAGSNRRFALVVALPFLSLAMSGMARAATYTVTNTLDSGTGSLRAAITAANTADGTNTIDFTVTGTIPLLSTLPAITDSGLTITGPLSAPGITIDGGGTVLVMTNSPGVALTLQNLTIAHGFQNAGDGGGVANESGTLTVTNCTFFSNSAELGGGIYNENEGALTVTNSTFSGNTALTGGGAGIFNVGTVTVTNSTFSGNSGNIGGAIANENTLAVTNSTFSGNAAPGLGGGIFNGGTLTVSNSTFSGSTDGGGIFDSLASITRLKGTILAGSSGGNCIGAIADASYSIADDSTCFTNGTNHNVVESSTSAVGLDPAGLQMNGGPTQTIALEPNSPALDFIPVPCTDLSGNPLTTDQRGFPRPDSGNLSFCDAGAFELQTGRITVVPGSEKTQIARPINSSDSDQVNIAFTFIDHGSSVLDDAGPIVLSCDAGNNALNGINVDFYEGTCADLATATGGLLLDLSPFVVHSISGHTYGTIFQSDPPDTLQQMSETVLARIVTLSGLIGAPDGVPSCGEWTINIEVAGLDTATLGLGGGNPFALVVEDGDKNEGCFDITNAVVGGQIPPPTHKVRRGARRGRR